MRIVIVYGNDGSDVRIGKICRSLSSKGYDVHFVGWDRRPDTDKTIDLGTTHIHLMSMKTHMWRATLGGQIRFTWHAIRMLAKLRPEVVHCVNEDNTFGILPFRGILYKHLVCDVFDALLDRHSHRPKYITMVLRAVAGIVRFSVDRLIATDAVRFERFGRFRKKTVIVENVPEDPGDQLACLLPQGPVKIYVAGALSLGRGIKQILEAVDRVEGIEILSAGWSFDEFARETFLPHPKVTFKGIVTARQSLDLAAQCDAVLCYYAPVSINAIYASPNKIYDAMSVGRPSIINKEAKVSRWIEENNLGLACPYEDVDALVRVLESLKSNRENLFDFATRTREFFVQGYTWDKMESRLEEMYASL